MPIAFGGPQSDNAKVSPNLAGGSRAGNLPDGESPSAELGVALGSWTRTSTREFAAKCLRDCRRNPCVRTRFIACAANRLAPLRLDATP